MSYINNETIEEIIGLVKEEIAKNKIYTIMGTRVDEGMSRQQNNFIRNRYKELLKDLSMIEIQNDEDKITGLALAKLYETGKVKFGWPNFEFDQNYQNKVWKVLQLQPNTPALTSEFLKQFILLEETLKIKKAKVYGVFDELKPKKERYKTQLEKHTENRTKGIQLGVTIFELGDCKFSSSDDFAIKLKVEGNEETTDTATMINGKVVWNKNYSFKLQQRDQKLSIELFRKSSLGPFERMASRVIELEEIDPEQQRVEDEYELLSTSNESLPMCKLRIKLHYVYDTIKYFDNLYNKAARDYDIASDVLKTLLKFDQMYSKPFGLIMMGGIFDLVDMNTSNDLFKKITQIEDVSPNVRQSVMTIPKKSTDKPRLTSELISSQTENIIHKLKTVTQWDTLTKLMIGISLFINFISLIGRNNFLNLVVVTMVSVINFSKEKVEKNYYRLLFFVLAFVEIMDVLWFFTSYQTFWNIRNEECTSSNLRKWIYFLGFIDIVVKGEFTYVTYNKSKEV